MNNANEQRQIRMPSLRSQLSRTCFTDIIAHAKTLRLVNIIIITLVENRGIVCEAVPSKHIAGNPQISVEIYPLQNQSAYEAVPT